MSRHAKRAVERRANARSNRLRIIGGCWRGVPISFPSRPELRPTPDRVRETIFNWLQPVIADARCLDLFAGSGALGFEALSRGASQVVCVDHDREIVRQLSETAQTLRATGFTAVESGALQFLSATPQPFDIVFLDPPYAANILADVCSRLTQGWLAPDALIYLEAPADAGLPTLPAGWSVHRSKRAGQVGYHLLRAC